MSKKKHTQSEIAEPVEPKAEAAPEPSVEPCSLAADEVAPPATLDELAAERARADENYDLYLRAVAELDNFRKRTRQEMVEFRKFAAEGLVGQLLEVADNLARALESADAGGDGGALAQGVSMTLRQLMDVLASHGLRRIEADGRQFDPNLHEAVLRVDTGPEMDNVVVEEMQAGYTLHGRVVRPALVKVGRCAEPETEVAPAEV